MPCWPVTTGWPTQASVTLPELAEEPLVLYLQGPSPHNTEEMLRAAGITPRIVHTSSNIEVVRCLVARGLGWTHAIQRWPLDISLEGLPLAAVPLVGDIPAHLVVAAWPAQDRLSRRAAAVVAFLKAAARRIPGFDWAELDPRLLVAQTGAPAAT